MPRHFEYPTWVPRDRDGGGGQPPDPDPRWADHYARDLRLRAIERDPARTFDERARARAEVERSAEHQAWWASRPGSTPGRPERLAALARAAARPDPGPAGRHGPRQLRKADGRALIAARPRGEGA